MSHQWGKNLSSLIPSEKLFPIGVKLTRDYLLQVLDSVSCTSMLSITEVIYFHTESMYLRYYVSRTWCITCFITSRVSGRGNRIGPVFPSFRVHIQVLPSGVEITKFFYVSFGQVVKNFTCPKSFVFLLSVSSSKYPGLWCDVVWRQRMTSNNDSMAKTTMTYTWEVRQRWGVFIFWITKKCLAFLPHFTLHCLVRHIVNN